jgi:hypothetical protein
MGDKGNFEEKNGEGGLNTFSILILNFVGDENLSTSNRCSLIEFTLNHSQIFFGQLNVKI